ncbi:hypothetical protein [Streptomyces sp. NBRC 110028]|uniref:hypothetical protein n=1 Tax=Streptomyces sp. NBRC 110028 TaxID=1621260 RepID=UPI0006E30E84|nr:hypothetical protein [Streptomyces sp. NBRC 110028]
MEAAGWLFGDQERTVVTAERADGLGSVTAGGHKSSRHQQRGLVDLGYGGTTSEVTANRPAGGSILLARGQGPQRSPSRR